MHQPHPAAIARHPHLAEPLRAGWVRVDLHSHTMWSGDSTTTPEEIEEFILVARSWVRQPVEADAVMELPLEEMRGMFGQWGQGATDEGDGRTRWPVGGADFRETMYGLSWIPAGVEFTTDLAEPAREELRETLERMLRALAAHDLSYFDRVLEDVSVHCLECTDRDHARGSAAGVVF